MDRLIGIVRSETALTARQVRQIRAVDFTDVEAVTDAFSEDAGVWYEFADSSPELAPDSRRLLDDWNALSDAAVPDPDAVRRLLAGTVLEQTSSSPVPPLPSPAPRTAPTAAHSRAYAGTKYKPPKPKAAMAVDWRPSLCDPRAYEATAAEARLPSSFRASLYPLVRAGGDAKVADALALYWAPGLDSNSERLTAVASLFSLPNGRHHHDWCRIITHQPPAFWTALLHFLIASGADTEEAPPGFGALLSETLDGPDPLYRAYWLLHGLTTGIDPAYLVAGYRLADTLRQSYAFHSVRQSGVCSISTLQRWGEHCRIDSDFYAGLLLRLWEQCGLRGGLSECLERHDWTQLTPKASWRFLRLLSTSWDDWGDLPDAEADAKWAAAKLQIGLMAELAASVPVAYQDKCVQNLEEYLWQWDTPAKLQEYLPPALTLTRRLCRPPFAEKSDPTVATTDFLAELPSALRERFLNATDSSFKRLEQACRRENDAMLIGRGTWALTRRQPKFTVDCFETDPARLFKAAKLLGTLPAPRRDDVVRAFALLPGEMPRLGLARLEEAATAALATGFPADADADPHALQMQSLVRENRRALRKLLAAHWEGQTDYRQTHPLTRRWLAAHPALDLAKWTAGVVIEAEHKTRGPLTLAIEQNPTEALKLGTYVGSCLGLGGAFTYSAAAVVLDINKQVVYARDKRGTVVARQLVAISEADQLVCYEVYPLSAQKELGAAFREFDMQLASALGLPLYQRAETEDYEIAHILSHDWWDDGVWDFAEDTQ